ncbi:tetratricopeptide repeat protein [Craurococcus roseus]|uniref:Tetratricopeptide repeat protein n=1 Tax=Craurococcus roseus TaxID=77585 RepID=A0ABN1EN90_9PROT
MTPPRPAVTVAAAALLGLLWCGPGGASGQSARFGGGPDHERCFGLLRTDPEDARFFADGWEAAGGGDGARHCAALALLALGETERGAERLEDLARRSEADAAARAAVFAEAGNAWMLAGDADRAYAAATMALTLAPDDPALVLDRALALGAMERYAEALEDLDRAVALDPSRIDAWVLRGAAKRQLGRAAEAERDVAHALSLAPDNAEALLERAALRRAKGDVRGARADWERAMRMATDSETADLARRNLELNPLPPQRRQR